MKSKYRLAFCSSSYPSFIRPEPSMPVSIACYVALIPFPIRRPAKGKRSFPRAAANTSSTTARYSLPPSTIITSKRSRPVDRTCSRKVEIETGFVDLFLKVTSRFIDTAEAAVPNRRSVRLLPHLLPHFPSYYPIRRPGSLLCRYVDLL